MDATADRPLLVHFFPDPVLSLVDTANSLHSNTLIESAVMLSGGILAYLILGILAGFGCVSCSRRFRVDSTFSRCGLSRFVRDLAAAPLAAILAFPLAIPFWPLLCLWDLAEIPRRIRARNQTSKHRDVRPMLEPGRDRPLIGECGFTFGVLSPMGKVRIHDQIWDATLAWILGPRKTCASPRSARRYAPRRRSAGRVSFN